ncbi:ester cyclase [Streptomyces sp. NBC_01006]|uniref:ester cyclase n=1 Tax=Streptomyces sp. NBC_01006 TaxID=2903716 RepID=UPI003863F12C|nr:ester cyclase [Streptomyces sp. NBC_01006]
MVLPPGRTARAKVGRSGWTPDGRDAFAENNRLASRSVWDGTIAGSGRAADFTTLDFFRIEGGLIVEHWESVDWVREYQAFGLLSDDIRDA